MKTYEQIRERKNKANKRWRLRLKGVAVPIRNNPYTKQQKELIISAYQTKGKKANLSLQKRQNN